MNVFESIDPGNDRNWFAENCKAYSFLYPDANNELCSRRGFEPLPKLVSSPELPSVNPDPKKDEKLLQGLEMTEKPDGGKTPKFLLTHKDEKNMLKSFRRLNFEGQEAQETRVEKNSSKEKTKNKKRFSFSNVVEKAKERFKKKKKN